jgi:hypothetical protein
MSGNNVIKVIIIIIIIIIIILIIIVKFWFHLWDFYRYSERYLWL